MKRTLCSFCALVALSIASSAFAAEQVDNPAYKAWASYKPGTSVTHKSSTQMTMEGMPGGGHQMESTMTEKLVEVKPDAVTVEVTMEMSGAGMPPGMGKQPAHNITIPAKVDKDKEGVPDMSKMPGKAEIKDMKIGTDSIDVNGKKVDVATREFTMVLTSPQMGEMTSKVKTWYTPDVPGGMVKMESHMEGKMQMTQTSQLVDFHIEK